MEKADFDPAETIAGFPLLSIKRALSGVGFMEDRDDVARVAEALACPRSQAERVLAALERRGLVTPTPVKNQWETTVLGWQLAMRWKPPPRLEPAIRLDDDDDESVYSEMFDEVPCSLLRTPRDDEEAFEEARLEVGVMIEYASPRVIEISVSVPDDYAHPESSATIESSVYIDVDDAKRFAKTLAEAIARAESEIKRRATLKPRKKPTRDGGATPSGKRGAATDVERATPRAAPLKPAAIARAAAAAEAAKRKEERAAEKKQKSEQRALEATLKELGKKQKRGRTK